MNAITISMIEQIEVYCLLTTASLLKSLMKPLISLTILETPPTKNMLQKHYLPLKFLSNCCGV